MPQKEVGKRSSITFFGFRDSFGHFARLLLRQGECWMSHLEYSFHNGKQKHNNTRALELVLRKWGSKFYTPPPLKIPFGGVAYEKEGGLGGGIKILLWAGGFKMYTHPSPP